MRAGKQVGAAIGAAEHGNEMVLVTLSQDGQLLDRRRLALTRGLPTHPYHHEGSWAVGRYKNSPWARDITLDEAVALVRRVREAALHGAREALEQIAAAVSLPITGIAVRALPSLPATIEETIADPRAHTMADSAMYREALANAARARDWVVHAYDRDEVFAQAAKRRGVDAVDATLRAMGKAAGPPWQAIHKLAAAAALAIAC